MNSVKKFVSGVGTKMLTSFTSDSEERNTYLEQESSTPYCNQNYEFVQEEPNENNHVRGKCTFDNNLPQQERIKIQSNMTNKTYPIEVNATIVKSSPMNREHREISNPDSVDRECLFSERVGFRDSTINTHRSSHQN